MESMRPLTGWWNRFITFKSKLSKIWALTLNVILEIPNDMDRPIVHCCFVNVASSTRRKPKSWKNELEE